MGGITPETTVIKKFYGGPHFLKFRGRPGQEGHKVRISATVTVLNNIRTQF
jgi:hypothetical protein